MLCLSSYKCVVSTLSKQCDQYMVASNLSSTAFFMVASNRPIHAFVGKRLIRQANLNSRVFASANLGDHESVVNQFCSSDDLRRYIALDYVDSL